MHFEGTQQLQLDIPTVWALLNDPAVLTRATPGIKELNPTAPDDYSAVFHIKMGPLNSIFTGRLQVVNKVDHESYRLLVDVNAKIGIISAAVDLTISTDETGTLVSFNGDGKLNGKLAQMGSRMLTPVARLFTKMFFKQLVKEAQ